MMNMRLMSMIILAISLSGRVTTKMPYGTLVSDRDQVYNRSGFSVKPPKGKSWYVLPTKSEIPNSVDFRIISINETKAPGQSEGNMTFLRAMSSTLDEPVTSRENTDTIADALRSHLDRYKDSGEFKVFKSGFEKFSGFDCLRFDGRNVKERFVVDWGDVRVSNLHGYFCLHPTQNNFGVIMFSMDGATAGTTPVARDQETAPFFKSLHFAQISTAVSRTYVRSEHTVGNTPFQLTMYRGMIWAALRDENRVVKIDPHDGKVVASVEVGKLPTSITSGENGVWVVNEGDATVSHVDPATNLLEATIPVGGRIVSVASGRGGIWVADAAGNRVVRIDPRSNSVVASIDVGREPVSVNVGGEGVWCANSGDGTVMVIDTDKDQVVSTIKVGGNPVRVSLANSGGWIADATGNQVVRLDRKKKAVVNKIKLGAKPSWIFSVDNGEVYVALPDASQIVRIDPAMDRVFGPPIKVEGTPRSMYFSNDSLWVAKNSGAVTRIKLTPFGQAISSQ